MADRQSSPSELQIALDNRAFEIQLFWQRSNYFIVLMTALGVGVFTIDIPKYAFFISVFAAISSWYWYKTNLGSKFWQESWEVEVVKLAKELNIRSFERPTPDIIDQVRESLENGWMLSGKGAVRKFIDRQILKKPSVSHYMIMLSLTSMGLWTLVSAFYAIDMYFSIPSESQAPIRSQQVSAQKKVESTQPATTPIVADNVASEPSALPSLGATGSAPQPQPSAASASEADRSSENARTTDSAPD